MHEKRARCYEGESKSNAFFFSQGMITFTRTCLTHQNKADSLWITSLLLNIVTVSLHSNVTTLNESMYPKLLKLRWLFFEPRHHCNFHSIITGMKSAAETFFHGAEEMSVTWKWKLKWWSGAKNSQQNCIYIQIFLKSVYLGSKSLFEQVLLKTIEHCILFLILFFQDCLLFF